MELPAAIERDAIGGLANVSTRMPESELDRRVAAGSGNERIDQIRAVHVIVRKAVGVLDDAPERRRRDRLAGTPVAHFGALGQERDAAERAFEPQLMQHAHAVRTQLDAGADRAERARLLEQPNAPSPPRKRSAQVSPPIPPPTISTARRDSFDRSIQRPVACGRASGAERRARVNRARRWRRRRPLFGIVGAVGSLGGIYSGPAGEAQDGTHTAV